MRQLRIFLTWLLLAALPLQGLAAVSMLHCAPAMHSHSDSQSGAGDPGIVHHDGAAHHDGGHEAHSHPGASGDHDDGSARAHHDSANSPDPAHKCSACASCCQQAAVTNLLHVPAMTGEPVAPDEPRARSVANRIPSVPDKPPRA